MKKTQKAKNSKNFTSPPSLEQNYKNNQQQEKSVAPFLMQQILSGPLPMSKEFEGYEKVLTGSANRILIMAEKEQENRLIIANQTIALQNKQLDNLKQIENKKATGDIIKKSTSALAITGIVIIAVLSKEQNLIPYLTLLAIIAAPSAKNFLIEKFFKSQ